MSSQQAINEVTLVESQTVHFARLKSSSGFEKINRNSTAITRISKFISCLPPEMMAGIVEENRCFI